MGSPEEKSRHFKTSSFDARAQMRDVTKLVLKMNSRRNLFDDGASQGSAAGEDANANSTRRSSTRSANALPFAEGNDAPYAASPLANAGLPLFEQSQDTASTFLDHAQHLENLFQKEPTYYNNGYLPHRRAHSSIEFQIQPSIEENQEEDAEGSDTGTTEPYDLEQGHSLQQPAKETTQLLPPTRRPKTSNLAYCCTRFAGILPPGFSISKSIKKFLSTTFLFLIVPGLLAAYLFYYPLANPNLEFLPSKARLSWFLLFAVRQSITFTLAQMTQWVLEVLTRTPLFVRVAGPLLALVAMQSMGWPFLLSAWGVWDLVLLHGSSPFVKHWFYWTGIQLFSIQYNTGDGILASDMYGRILASCIMVGVATSTKRTFVALYLSRNMLQNYRAKLEQVMSQIQLIMDVADLSAETDQPEFEQKIKESIHQVALDRKRDTFVERAPTFEKMKNSSSRKSSKPNLSSNNVDEDYSSSDDGSISSADQDLDRAMGDAGNIMDLSTDPKQFWSSMKARALADRDTIHFASDGSQDGKEVRTSASKQQQQRGSSAGSSSYYQGTSMSRILPFLDRWHEPKDKGAKISSPTLHDILQFKKAMSFMEGNFTFGPAYGSCASRKSCVKNAVRVYRKLLKFTPNESFLTFDVLGALAYHDDGEMDEEQVVALLRLFYPDKDNQLPMLAFVQACDNVYKKMRFLRASISNTTKIDSVLEDTFNAVFYCTLAIMVLTFCGFNPWPLLVSFSTLTVSFAFAFGPSVAKNIEGILMIAVRRPYDIGDRITITGAESVATPNAADSWLVEDITLSTTTLRYGATNELATINNASVANSRIVNLARSPKAMVSIRVQLDVDATQRQLDDFRRSLEDYLKNHPRKWIALIHYRAESIDSDLGYVTYLYRAQHVRPWQELGAIMIDKGDWERHASVVANEMGIAYDSGPAQVTVGLGIAKESPANQATLDRQEVASFVRSIGSANENGVLGSIAECLDAGQPLS